MRDGATLMGSKWLQTWLSLEQALLKRKVEAE